MNPKLVLHMVLSSIIISFFTERIEDDFDYYVLKFLHFKLLLFQIQVLLKKANLVTLS